MKKISVAGIALACHVALSAASCDEKNLVAAGCLDMDHVPEPYRACINSIVPLPKGQITLKEAAVLLGKLNANQFALRRCGNGGFDWADRQVDLCKAKLRAR